MPIPVWQSGTLYQPGDLVKPVLSGSVTPPTITNGNFEDGPTDGLPPADWTVLAESNGAIDAKNDAPTFDGDWAMQIFANENSVCQVISDTEVACAPGDLVTFRAYVQWVSGDDPRFSWLQLSIRWFTSGDVELAPTIAYVLGSSESNGQTAQQVWAQRTVAGVAPANAAYCRLRFDATSDDSDVGTWRIDTCTIDFASQGAPNPFLFRAVQAASGFSGSTEPDWPVILGGQVVDNEVTWEAVPANTVTWQASRILVTGASEPTPWPDAVGGSILDNTIVWQLDSRRVTDERVPSDSTVVLAASSKVFAADDDIINFSATVNPLDWSTPEDAGYVAFGLQQYGGNPVTAMGLYRGNLAAFNSEGCQLWQLDEDPAGITYLDAIPVPCTFPKTVQPVGDDLALLTNLGARSLGLSGAAVNLQGGYFGQQIDPLVTAAIAAANLAGLEPFALYWAARGQYWLIFGATAYVLTITGGPNGKLTRSWSRYEFPEIITDWTILGTDLTLRTFTDKIWVVDPDALQDDMYLPSSLAFEGAPTEAGELLMWPNAVVAFRQALIEGPVSPDGYEVQPQLAPSVAMVWQLVTSQTTTVRVTGEDVDGNVISEDIECTSRYALGELEFANFTDVEVLVSSGGGDNFYSVGYRSFVPGGDSLNCTLRASYGIRESTTGTFDFEGFLQPTWGADPPFALPYDECTITIMRNLNAAARTFTINGSEQLVLPAGSSGDEVSSVETYSEITSLTSTGASQIFVDVGITFEIPLEGTPFEGVIQWPFLDLKVPGNDKTLLAFDLAIDGTAFVSVGWDENEIEYDVDGAWTAEYEVDGDTVPGTPVPFEVTGPTLSFRLRFAGGQAWEWMATNMYVKDLTV